jgi:hypothetical protein
VGIRKCDPRLLQINKNSLSVGISVNCDTAAVRGLVVYVRHCVALRRAPALKIELQNTVSCAILREDTRWPKKLTWVNDQQAS